MGGGGGRTRERTRDVYNGGLHVAYGDWSVFRKICISDPLEIARGYSS